MKDLKRYELSVSKGFDSFPELLDYLNLIRLEIENEADHDFGILTLDEGISGNGYDVELFGEEKVL